MDKQTTYTYTAYNASIHFCTSDSEIVINDHAGGEVVTIEGLNSRDLHGAMINYVHNVSLRKDKETFLDFLKGLQKEVEKTLEVYGVFLP
jgi:thioredoxin-related protein